MEGTGQLQAEGEGVLPGQQTQQIIKQCRVQIKDVMKQTNLPAFQIHDVTKLRCNLQTDTKPGTSSTKPKSMDGTDQVESEDGWIKQEPMSPEEEQSEQSHKQVKEIPAFNGDEDFTDSDSDWVIDEEDGEENEDEWIPDSDEESPSPEEGSCPDDTRSDSLLSEKSSENKGKAQNQDDDFYLAQTLDNDTLTKIMQVVYKVQKPNIDTLVLLKDQMEERPKLKIKLLKDLKYGNSMFQKGGRKTGSKKRIVVQRNMTIQSESEVVDEPKPKEFGSSNWTPHQPLTLAKATAHIAAKDPQKDSKQQVAQVGARKDSKSGDDKNTVHWLPPGHPSMFVRRIAPKLPTQYVLQRQDRMRKILPKLPNTTGAQSHVPKPVISSRNQTVQKLPTPPVPENIKFLDQSSLAARAVFLPQSRTIKIPELEAGPPGSMDVLVPVDTSGQMKPPFMAIPVNSCNLVFSSEGNAKTDKETKVNQSGTDDVVLGTPKFSGPQPKPVENMSSSQQLASDSSKTINDAANESLCSQRSNTEVNTTAPEHGPATSKSDAIQQSVQQPVPSQPSRSDAIQTVVQQLAQQSMPLPVAGVFANTLPTVVSARPAVPPRMLMPRVGLQTGTRASGHYGLIPAGIVRPGFPRVLPPGIVPTSLLPPVVLPGGINSSSIPSNPSMYRPQFPCTCPPGTQPPRIPAYPGAPNHLRAPLSNTGNEQSPLLKNPIMPSSNHTAYNVSNTQTPGERFPELFRNSDIPISPSVTKKDVSQNNLFRREEVNSTEIKISNIRSCADRRPVSSDSPAELMNPASPHRNESKRCPSMTTVTSVNSCASAEDSHKIDPTLKSEPVQPKLDSPPAQKHMTGGSKHPGSLVTIILPKSAEQHYRPHQPGYSKDLEDDIKEISKPASKVDLGLVWNEIDHIKTDLQFIKTNIAGEIQALRMEMDRFMQQVRDKIGIQVCTAGIEHEHDGGKSVSRKRKAPDDHDVTNEKAKLARSPLITVEPKKPSTS